MTGIILTGHGKIAEGMESAVRLVFGKPEKFYTINFTEDITPELLEKEIEEKINELNGEKGVLVFTDIAGGTPFKTASVLSLKKEKVKVISGMNLPMVLETVCEREGYDSINELYLNAVETGKSQITGFELKDTKSKNEGEFEEGI